MGLRGLAKEQADGVDVIAIVALLVLVSRGVLKDAF